MDEAALARIAPDLVRVAWGRVVRSAEPLGGGMNSTTALLKLPDGSFVAKWVPTASAGALASGCEVAQLLAGRGLVTGEPLPTLDGRLTVPVGQGAAALLRFVAGEPLTADSVRDQLAMAVTLARVHAAETTTSSAPFMSDEVAELVHDVQPWIRPTVGVVLDEYDRLPALTWGVLHGDPAPEAFRRQETGEVALIDWTASARGPVLYDVASAVMYLGGRVKAEAFWHRLRRHQSRAGRRAAAAPRGVQPSSGRRAGGLLLDAGRDRGPDRDRRSAGELERATGCRADAAGERRRTRRRAAIARDGRIACEATWNLELGGPVRRSPRGEWRNAAPAERYSAKAVLFGARGHVPDRSRSPTYEARPVFRRPHRRHFAWVCDTPM